MSATASPELNREIATTADGMDITRGYVGPLLSPYDSVLRSRGGGDLQIYEQVLSDPQVKSCFAQRQLAVTKCEWQVDAASDKRVDKKAAEWMRGQLDTIGWDRITTRMLFGVFYGFAVAEMVYARQGDMIGIDQVKVRNRRRFRYGKDMDLRLLTYGNMLEGVSAEAPYFWDYATGADNDDEPYGLGLAHWLYWPVLFKRNGLKFWLIFLEKFGMPTAKGTYPAGATSDERNKLLQATRAIQTDSGIIMPEGMMLELIEAGRSGSADYQAMHDTMDATIAKVIIGQTASSQGTPGKLGNDQLQSDVRADIIKADADLICESWNRGPGTWLTHWNFPGAEVPRVYRITDEPEDLQARATRDKMVQAMGFKPTLGYIHDTYGGQWIAQAAPKPAGAPGADPNADPNADPGADPGAQFAEGEQPQDAPARMTDQLDQRMAPVVDDWVAKVRELVDKAESLDDLRSGLLALAPDMSLEQYADAMREGLTAAALAGRYEVLQEASTP